jgi:hypothetical protein
MAGNVIGSGETCVAERTGTITATIFFQPCGAIFTRSSLIACGIKGCGSTIRKGGYRVTGDAAACAAGSWLNTGLSTITYNKTDVGMGFDAPPTVSSASFSFAFHGSNIIRCLAVPGGTIEDLSESFTGTIAGTI